MSNFDPIEQITGALAIHFGRGGRRLGPAPDDEELSAFYDNRLDDNRRGQIISHIANDISVYRRWLQMVHTQTVFEQELNLPRSAPSAAPSSPRRGFWSGWLRHVGSPGGMWGSGLAAVAAVVLVVLVFPISRLDYRTAFDQAYSEWPAAIQDGWNRSAYGSQPAQLPGRALQPGREKTAAAKILETGFRRGADQFGEQVFASQGIHRSTLMSEPYRPTLNVTPEQYQLLIDLGHIGALAWVQCKLDEKSRKLIQLQPAVANLADRLARTGVNEAVLWTQRFSQAQGAAAVCALAEDIAVEIKDGH